MSHNDKIEFNFDFYYYLHEHGIPDVEKKFRKRVIQELRDFYEREVRKLNEDEIKLLR